MKKDSKKADKVKTFKSLQEAVENFAKYAIPMTDETNKEHAAVLINKDNKYYYTKIERGFHNTVWPTALKHIFCKKEKYFLHTHPNSGRKDLRGKNTDNNPFSGVPGSRKLSDAGDAYVVDVLGYDGIFLVSAKGNAYLYRGVGITMPQKNTFANSKKEMAGLKPIFGGMTQSKYCYKLKMGKKAEVNKYIKEQWSAD